PVFEQEMRQTPEVLDCWLVSGSFDFLVRIGCRSMAHYCQLADSWLTSKKFHVDKIVTLTELQAIKRS
ncbi:Lrp/AsnC ligand binding domain-containing protein, partial [Klebsiella oxytoca]